LGRNAKKIQYFPTTIKRMTRRNHGWLRKIEKHKKKDKGMSCLFPGEEKNQYH